LAIWGKCGLKYLFTVAVNKGYAHKKTVEDPKARIRFGLEVTRGLQDLGAKLGITNYRAKDAANHNGY
jgi:hypothetical protein